jgi:flagellar hook protein FlgE
MSFRISLSGMNAATADLNVTSNNIANANTTGFKQSRAEFGDVFAASANGLARNAIGAGVKLAAIAQQFGQGNIDFTGRNLDLAISGQGFFTLSDGGATVYSRAGNFGADADGFVVNPAGQRLQVYQPNSTGTGFDTGRLGDLQLSTGDSPPRASSTVTVQSNLPADATAPTTTPFAPTDPNTYNRTTSLTVYDSLGAAHSQSMYFVKTANPT